MSRSFSCILSGLWNGSKDSSGARKAFRLSLAGLIALLSLAPLGLQGQAPNVPTWRYDNTRQGQNTQETTLTPNNVNTNTFGKLFSQPVDGQVYAQPLYMYQLKLGNGTTHNVVFIATEHDSVYAFDADSNGGTGSAPLWQASMISTAHGAAAGATTMPYGDVQGGSGDIHPEIGITGTPVLDTAAGTLFVLAKSKENGVYVQRLHALSVATGNERSGSPVVLSASVAGTGNGSAGGTLAFSSLWQNNRMALSLFNGSLYIGFGAHGDDGPWHGWVLVYNETSLAQTAAICLSPNGDGDGLWMSGAGMAIDTVAANGRAFVATGNGDLTDYPPINTAQDYGESVLRFDLSNGGFAPTDAFTAYNQASLTGSDLDMAAGGVLMLPDQPGPYPHLLIQIGKEGRIVVLNRDALNGYAPGGAYNTNAVQDITGAFANGGLWSTPAYWNGNVYVWASNDSLKVFPLTNGVLAKTAAVRSSVSSSFPGATPSVSSNGTQNGIVWALDTDMFGSNGSSILYAFNATNIASPIYASNQNVMRDDAGPAIKFTVPVVTNGKVYVGAGYQVDVYGLLNGQTQSPAPVIAPAGGTYSAAQTVTITDTAANTAIYYTTDGSTPTTASTLYTGSFVASADMTVQAIASSSGFLQSAITSATYIFNSQTPAPQFTPAAGTYTTTQSVTMTDSAAGANIYYTTNGATPTAQSTKYTGALTVSTNTTFQAIAIADGLTASNVVTAGYAIQPNGTEINYGSGFSNAAGLTLNGSATNADDTRLQLTTGGGYQRGSVFYNTPTNIQAFTTDFAFQLSNAYGDGFTFTMQNVGPTALGGDGGSLGYGPNPSNGGTTGGIAKSVALKFDFFSNAGEGADSTGIYLNGASPTVPATDMTQSGVLLGSGDTMTAHVTYDGTNLILTLTDVVVNKVFTHTFPVNIASTLGSNLAYIGFTGGTGSNSSSQKIESWTFTAQTPAVTATPQYAPAAGTYTTAQSVTLSDTTSGAVIYYTVDGSMPTTASAVYGAPISVKTGTETIKALSVAPGSAASAVASATYTIQTAVTATPAFAPGTGTYTGAQSVALSDATAGAVIYYTTNGTTPTTASAVYSGAIKVSTNETLEAIAVAQGYSQSATATAAYVIQSASGNGINFASGFGNGAGLQLNSVATVNANNYLQLTNGGTYQAGSAFATTPVNIQSFNTSFTFQLSNAVADGFTFTIQNAGLTALGGQGGSLGYGPTTLAGTTGGIGNSVAVKFDFYNNNNEGTDSTGFYVNGAVPTVPAQSMTASGVVLSSGDTMAAQLAYDGTTLTFNVTDTVTSKTFTYAAAVNIPNAVGGSTAYVGFTGGAGGSSAVQNIKTWTFTSGTAKTAADPVFSPAPGTYSDAQNVLLSTATAGAKIYYTVDGSTPTTNSTVYSAPIVASGNSLTIRAFAAATGYQNSPIVVGTYQVPVPVINFATDFGSGAGLQLNSVAAVNANSYLVLTNGGTYQASSAFWTKPVNIQSFATKFTFQLTNAQADGFTFTIQNAAPTAVGGSGGSLGYGPTDLGGTTGGIGTSVAVKFDFFNNNNEGTDSTGFYLNGAVPTVPAQSLTASGVVLSSGDTMAAQLTYDGTTLTLNVTDTVTSKTFSYAAAVNIPAAVGGATAYVGFTGGEGGLSAVQNIKTWTFSPGTP